MQADINRYKAECTIYGDPSQFYNLLDAKCKYNRLVWYERAFDIMKTQGLEFEEALVYDGQVLSNGEMSLNNLKKAFIDGKHRFYACKNKSNEWIVIVDWDEESDEVVYYTTAKEKKFSNASAILNETVYWELPIY